MIESDAGGEVAERELDVAAEACRTAVGRKLGREDIQCRPLPLEDMFIELVGRDT